MQGREVSKVSKKKKLYVHNPDAQAITLKRVLESGVLAGHDISNEFMHLGVRKDGGEWFKDQKSGRAYGIVDIENTLEVVEVHESKIIRKKEAARAQITCCECGAKREVATQDVFQVKRCVECQRKLRNGKCKIAEKARRARRKAERELARLNMKQEVME